VPFGFWQGVWSNPLDLVPGSQPAAPRLPHGTTPILQAASLDDIQSHAVLVSGTWPSGAPAGGVIPAALPASAAALLKLHVGDTIRLQESTTSAKLTFRLTGLFAQRQLPGTSVSYWQLDAVPASGSATASGFATYGPLIVAPSVFPQQPTGGGLAPGQLSPGTGTWVAQPAMSLIGSADLSSLSAAVSSLISTAPSSTLLNSVRLSTKLPTVLADTGSNLAVARSLLAVSALQLIVLALAALVAVARLLAAQRDGETALLTSRGATRGQLVALTAAEVVPLSVLAALAGGAVGIWLARILGSTVGSSIGNAVSLRAAGTWLDALAAAVLIMLLAVGALLAPALRRQPATASRVHRGRQALIAGASRAGIDLALLVLGVLAGWQLRQYSAVNASASAGAGSGTAPTIDPVLVLAPALALAGGTVLTLRLLPLGARAVDHLAARGRGLIAALAGWQFSRQPLRQGGAALLLVMAVGTGTLALAQHASWTRSAADQAAFTTGGDAQVDPAVPLTAAQTARLRSVPGVTATMPVAATTQSSPGNLLAVDAAKALPVVQLRPDEAPLSASSLFALISPKNGPPGSPVPGQPRSVNLTASVSGLPIGPVTAVFTVMDADGNVFQLPASAPLPQDGRPHVLSAPLDAAGGVAYPLRLLQVGFTFTIPQQQRSAGSADFTVGGAGMSAWAATASSPDLEEAGTGPPTAPPFAEPRAASTVRVPGGLKVHLDSGYGPVYILHETNSGGTYTSAVAHGQLSLAPVPPTSVPAIVNQAYVDANKTGAGALVNASVYGEQVPVEIAAVATTFPTTTAPTMIMDLPALQSTLVSLGGAPLTVNQWWLATTGHQVPPALTAALPPGATVTSTTALTAATLADPLSAAPQQALLAMVVAAALLAITGFWVSIAADVRQRRAESALLAALGIGQRAAAVQLFAEKLLLSVPSAVLGLLLGTVVARLLIPAVTLTSTAQLPVPPPVTLYDLSQTGPLSAAVALIPALAAALVVFRRPDPAAELRAAEAA
jgi:hypothetical protein